MIPNRKTGVSGRGVNDASNYQIFCLFLISCYLGCRRLSFLDRTGCRQKFWFYMGFLEEKKVKDHWLSTLRCRKPKNPQTYPISLSIYLRLMSHCDNLVHGKFQIQSKENIVIVYIKGITSELQMKPVITLSGFHCTTQSSWIKSMFSNLSLGRVLEVWWYGA